MPRRWRRVAASALAITIVFPIPTYADESTFAHGRGATGVVPTGAPNTGADVVSAQGAAVHHIPIDVPVGTGGLQPSLALSYSSHSRSDSWVGYGWSLELGSIARSLKEGVPGYDTTDTYTLSGQDLVPSATISNRFHTKRESFTRIQYDPQADSWEVRSKDGRVARYGVTAAARVGNGEGVTFTWGLEQLEDAHGNIVLVTYYSSAEIPDAGRVYPKEVRYTLRRSGSVLNSLNGVPPPQPGVDRVISFSLEQRPDPSVSYAAGFERYLGHRLAYIDVVASDATYRRYELIYGAPSSDSGRSLLRQVDAFGSGNGPEPPRSTVFSYHSNVEAGTEGWIESSTSAWKGGPEFTDSAGFDDNGVRVADLNGDALPDLVRGVRQAGQAMDAESGTYVNTGSDFASLDASWSFPTMPGSLQAAFLVDGVDMGTVLADLDRDGRADLLVLHRIFDAGNAIRYRWRELLYRNSGSGWDELLHDGSNMAGIQIPFQAPQEPTIDVAGHGFSNRGVNGSNQTSVSGFTRLADLNGDGGPDLWSHESISRLAHPFDFKTMSIKGFSLFDRATMSFPAPTNSAYSVATCTIVPFDCPDFGAAYAGSSYIEGSWAGVTAVRSYSSGQALIDVNGDGLSDYVRSREPNGYPYLKRFTHLNDGGDFVLDQAWVLPVDISWENSFVTGYMQDNGVRFVDVNGDGRIDIVRATIEPENPGYNVWLNSGDPGGPWVEQGASSPWNVPDADQPDGMAFVGTNGVDRGIRFLDLNGDGMADLLRAAGSEREVYLNRGSVPDLLTEVRTSLGATITYSYRPSTAFDHTPEGGGLPSLPSIYQLVDRVQVDDGFTPEAPLVISTDYSYEGGLWDGEAREFRGFRKVTATRSHDGRKVVREFHQSDELALLPLRESVVDAADVPWRVTEHGYTTDTDGPPYIALRTSLLVEEYDGKTDASGAPLSPRRALTEFEYDEGAAILLGNLTAMVEWGEVDATGADLEPLDTRVMTTGYVTKANPLVDLPYIVAPSIRRIREGSDPQGGAIVEEARTIYDGGGPIVRGLVTERRLIDDLDLETGATSAFTYDAYGNRTSITTPRAYAGQVVGSTIIEYDSTLYTFPTAITNELGQRSEVGYTAAAECAMQHPAAFGLPHTEANPNQIAASAAWLRCYDHFGRILEERAPEDMAFTRWAYADGLGSSTIVQLERTNSSGSERATLVTIDGLGRVRSSRTGGPQGRSIDARIVYDTAGRVQTEVYPHFTNDPTLEATRAYDPLDRVVELTLPGSGRVYRVEHDRGVSTRIDPNLNKIQERRNAFGLPTEVIQDPGGDTYATSYAYDVLGRLEAIVDDQKNLTEVEYALGGRQRVLRDPDTGTTTIDFDLNGNPVLVSGPLGATGYAYDALDRVLSQSPPGEQAYTWKYDLNLNGVGLLAEHRRLPAKSAPYEYDLIGRPTLEYHVTDVGDAIHQFVNTYDDLGNLLTRTYPGGVTIEWVRDSLGYLTEIRTLGGEVLASQIEWDAAGNLVRWVSGGGVATDIDFDSTTGRLSDMRVDGGALEHLRYVLDDADRILSITNPTDPSGHRGQYGYDAHDRVSQATGPFGAAGAWETRYFAYDSIGNATCLESLSPSDCSSGTAIAYPGAATAPTLFRKPHAPISVTRAGIANPATHDSAANLKVLLDREYTYDKLGQLITVESGGVATASIYYDANGARRVTDLAASKTLYLVTDDFRWDKAETRAEIRIGIAGKTIATYRSTYEGLPDGSCGLTAPAADVPPVPLWPFLPSLLLLAGLGAVRWTRVRPIAWRHGTACLTVTTFVVVYVVGDTGLTGRGVPTAKAQLLPDVTYFHVDHAGSPVLLTDSSGAIVQRLAYRLFGETIVLSGSTGSPEFGFTGQSFHAPAGIYDYGARWYDPTLGRFLQPDPIVPDASDPRTLNRFSYVLNNPVNLVDPTGTTAEGVPPIDSSDFFDDWTDPDFSPIPSGDFWWENDAALQGIDSPWWDCYGAYGCAPSNAYLAQFGIVGPDGPLIPPEMVAAYEREVEIPRFRSESQWSESPMSPQYTVGGLVGGSAIAGPAGIDLGLYAGLEYDLRRWWFPLLDVKVYFARTTALGTEGTGRAFGGEFDLDVVQFFGVRGGLATVFDSRTVSSDYSFGAFSARTFTRDIPAPPGEFLGAGFGTGGGFGYSFTVGGDAHLLFSAREFLGWSP